MATPAPASILRKKQLQCDICGICNSLKICCIGTPMFSPSHPITFGSPTKPSQHIAASPHPTSVSQLIHDFNKPNFQHFPTTKTWPLFSSLFGLPSKQPPKPHKTILKTHKKQPQRSRSVTAFSLRPTCAKWTAKARPKTGESTHLIFDDKFGACAPRPQIRVNLT